jgi:hypothetical protein
MRSLIPLALAPVAALVSPASRGLGAEPAEPAFSARQRSHWAFRAPVRPALPPVRDSAWVRTPVDAFILARLEQAGLRPAEPAGRAALLRRITFDLTGLPPTPQELDDFLQDTRPDAYVRVVERLLASPHYGERWAQHWLDVVRYAESNGYEADAERPHAWRYRDYVVSAFNDDKPYDRFVTEQLAGDLLGQAKGQHPPADADRSSWLIAAGFNRCGPVHQTSGNVDPVIGRQEILTEMTSAVGAAFLGLTVGCARCHHHKFDPFSQADYYRLQAFFSAAQPREVDLATPAEREEYNRRRREIEARLNPLRRQLQQLEAPYQQRLTRAKKDQLEPAYRAALETERDKRTPEQRQLAAHAEILIKVTWDEIVAALSPADRERRSRLREQIHEWEAQKPPPPARAWTIVENGAARTAHVLKRGDPHKPDAMVQAAFPRILSGGRQPPETSLGGLTPPAQGADAPRSEIPDRLALAAWLTRPDHPLTARVIVNRLWQHHFGRGLVATPNDFGLRGTPPSHPELLDWLARELVEQGWSLKHLHRLLVLSATYQQSSRWTDPRARTVDPDNRLLARMNRRRLEGEALRDNALAVAGTLNPTLGGPMIRVPLEPEIYELIFTEGEPDGLWPATPDTRQHTRRSLYLYNKRNVRLPLFEAFDQPDTLTSCPVRPVSTFAPQALILLNGPFMRAQASAFAVRLLHEQPGKENDWIDRAYRLALARPPKAEEQRMAVDFLHEQSDRLRERLRLRLPTAVPAGTPDGVDPARAAALADFCLALFNRNEFLYVD